MNEKALIIHDVLMSADYTYYVDAIVTRDGDTLFMTRFGDGGEEVPGLRVTINDLRDLVKFYEEGV